MQPDRTDVVKRGMEVNANNIINDLATQLATALRDLAVAREQVKMLSAPPPVEDNPLS